MHIMIFLIKKQYQEQQAILDKKIKDFYNEQINIIKEAERIERGKLENKFNKYLAKIESEIQNQNDMIDEEINEEEEENFCNDNEVSNIPESEIYEIDPTTILVSNIPESTTAKELCDFFIENFGEVKDVHIMQSIYSGKSYSRGIGFVEFKTRDSYQNALCYQIVEFESQYLVISQRKKRKLHITAFIKRYSARYYR